MGYSLKSLNLGLSPSTFTCVHVEDGEAEGGREIADESKDDNWPVAGVHVSLNEQGAQEHGACKSFKYFQSKLTTSRQQHITNMNLI